MTRFLTTRAIILRRINYGEADRILTMLTSDFGKIRLIAKGVRKQKSRMAGGLELFGVSEINFIKGRG
ncbi:DNA repair protein RecO, partial [Candidatus Saccharibacteria bacterium]|nr:DNA repair protein RecO [Candidatus Saccharibacteria bacterium]